MATRRSSQAPAAPALAESAAPAEAAQRDAQVVTPATPIVPAILAEAGAEPAQQPIAPLAPAPQNQNDLAWWAFGTGGLLFAGGLGALAWSRSRKRPGSTRAVKTEGRAPIIPPAVVPEARFAPVPEAAVVQSQPPVAPVRSVAPSHDAELEAMVAAPPSAENPFLTRKNRIRRASYILANRASLQASAQAPAMPVPSASQPKFKPQPVYDFGKAPHSARFSWKPVVT